MSDRQIILSLEKTERIDKEREAAEMRMEVISLDQEEVMSMLLHGYTTVASQALVEHFDKHGLNCKCQAFKLHSSIMKFLSEMENSPMASKVEKL